MAEGKFLQSLLFFSLRLILGYKWNFHYFGVYVSKKKKKKKKKSLQIKGKFFTRKVYIQAPEFFLK